MLEKVYISPVVLSQTRHNIDTCRGILFSRWNFFIGMYIPGGVFKNSYRIQEDAGRKYMGGTVPKWVQNNCKVGVQELSNGV